MNLKPRNDVVGLGIKALFWVSALFVLYPASTWSLTLEETVSQALRSNPDLLRETNQRLAREQELEQARSGYRPRVDLTAGYGYERSDNSTTRSLGFDGRSLTRREAGITLDQMLFDGYATRSEVERQNARLKSQAFTVSGTSENTALRAVEVYLQVLRHHELMKLSSDNLASHDRVFDQVALRSRSGVGRVADLDQITGRRSSASASLLADEVNLRDAESNFLRVVGALPESLQPQEQRLEKEIPETLEQAVLQAVDNHPTLKSAKADVESATAQHRASKHAFYPKFNLELGSTWGLDQDGQSGDNDDLTAMLRMRYNLFSGGRDKARSQETAHLINEAKEVRNRTYRQVVESIRLSWAAYQATRQQITYLAQHVAASEKTREAYTKQFNLGKRTLLDLLDNENELFKARRDYLDAKYDFLFSQYRILVGMGRLLGYLGIQEPEAGDPSGRVQATFAGIAGQTAVEEQIRPLKAGLSVESPSQEQQPDRETRWKREVRAFINAWKRDWTTQNIAGYLVRYSERFRPQSGLSRAAWAAQRRTTISRPEWIQIDLEGMRIRLEEQRAVVEFRQNYRASNYRDRVKKRLVLTRTNGIWLIDKEIVN